MKEAEFNFKTTKEIKVSKKIVDQVIGQDDAVNVIKKAAAQRRHVLLIGEPGTGKSMLGLALAELLPKEKLVDILAFPNPNDENYPLIRTVPASKGREMIAKAKMQDMGVFKNQNMLMFILAIAAMIIPWWVRAKYNSDIMFAAFFLGGMVFLGAFVIFLNLGKRMNNTKHQVPKLIVDNFKKKQAPFLDATGAHAGALLGDVLHDPFQTFLTKQWLQKKGENGIEKKRINEEIDIFMNKYPEKILKKKENNYEAIFLNKNELFVLGENNGSVSPVAVLSSNRYDYDGEMIKLTTSKNKELIVTPEHKVATWKSGKIAYIEARKIKEGDEVVAESRDIIIDEQDIINTYDKRQQEQCRLYYQYQEIKSQNPNWGYKRIAKAMGRPGSKTRWWHSGKHIPTPIQTVNCLNRKGLIPLKIDNSKLPLIAKVLGATFGDGGIFKNLNAIFLSSSELEATKEFGEDLTRIFGEEIDKNSRTIEAGIEGHSWCYQNTNRNVIRFFVALGCPTGKKTEQELRFPEWIKLKNYIEKEFYGSFLGSELGTPIIHKRGNYLTCLEVGISSRSDLKENRLVLLSELSNYLKKNRVNTTSVYQGKSKTEGKLIYRLLIEKKIDNVILFLMNIKINYCKYKIERLYNALGEWAKLKIQKYHELIERGYGSEHAMKILNLTPNSLYLLLNNFGSEEEAIS